jgi:hypothetical protein
MPNRLGALSATPRPLLSSYTSASAPFNVRRSIGSRHRLGGRAIFQTFDRPGVIALYTLYLRPRAINMYGC